VRDESLAVLKNHAAIQKSITTANTAGTAKILFFDSLIANFRMRYKTSRSLVFIAVYAVFAVVRNYWHHG
jgi:hypothetical protein